MLRFDTRHGAAPLETGRSPAGAAHAAAHAAARPPASAARATLAAAVTSTFAAALPARRGVAHPFELVGQEAQHHGALAVVEGVVQQQPLRTQGLVFLLAGLRFGVGRRAQGAQFGARVLRQRRGLRLQAFAPALAFAQDGAGAGFAAAIGKVGAIMTAFLFPILLATIGTSTLLYCLVVTSLLGAVVTWMFRIETTGVNLDRIGK